MDEVVASYLEGESQDYKETVKTALNAHEDVTAGRTRPASEFLEELLVRHGLSR